MRGKALVHSFGSLDVRITPAHAGKRRAVYAACSAAWDHPRVCGEKFESKSTLYHYLGSPPCMRGKDGLRDDAQRYRGITPAYAGKSL